MVRIVEDVNSQFPCEIENMAASTFAKLQLQNFLGGLIMRIMLAIKFNK